MAAPAWMELAYTGTLLVYRVRVCEAAVATVYGIIEAAANDMYKRYGLFHWIEPGKSAALVESMIEGSALCSAVYLCFRPRATHITVRSPSPPQEPFGATHGGASPSPAQTPGALTLSSTAPTLLPGHDLVATFTLERTPLSPYYPPGAWLEPTAPAVYLSNLAVMPTAQGQGLGRDVIALAEIMARSMDARWIRLDYVVEHPRLERLYRSAGFVGAKCELVPQIIRNPACGHHSFPCMESTCGSRSPPATLHCALMEKAISRE
eukprot:m.237187 g.237187  ORF g.237187 m.237187 type:complete len:264 (-) comp13096_c0_seq1:171-962(-)